MISVISIYMTVFLAGHPPIGAVHHSEILVTSEQACPIESDQWVEGTVDTLVKRFTDLGYKVDEITFNYEFECQ